MKTIEKPHYLNPKLEEELKTGLQKLDHAVVIGGENYGRRSLPLLKETNVSPFFEEHHRQAEAMLGKIDMEVPKASLIAEVQEDEKLMDTKVQAIENKLHKIKEQQHGAQAKLEGQKPPFNKARLVLAWIAVSLPLLGDAVISIPIWETWGFNFIESVLISLVFAGTLITFSHYFWRIVCLIGKTEWQRRAVATGLFLLIVMCFYFMAEARADLRSAQMAAQGIDVHFKPIPFALVSGLIFIMALAISHFAFPSRAEREQMAEFERLKSEYQQLLEQEQELEQEKADIIAKHNQLRQANLSILLRAAALEDMVISAAKLGYTKWKRANTMHRPDRMRPAAFNDDTYPFSFQTSFSDIKTLYA